MEIILNVKNLCKHFGGVQALKDVSFDVKKGEVFIIAGENGAGKSTFIKILSGVYAPDEGEIYFQEEKIEDFHPYSSLRKGITTIFQESSVYENLSVTENVFVMNKIKKKNSPFLDWKSMELRAAELFEELGETINVKSNLINMTAGLKKIVEIARALVQDTRCIIMDEPTSSLSDKEVKKLFNQIEILKKRGISIIYITHKLDEVFEIGDRISVFRDGRLIETCPVKDLSRERLIELMIDRSIDTYYPRIEDNNKNPVFEVSNFTSSYGLFKGVSFTARKGEILGIYGLVGAGRSELAQAICGIDQNHHGDVVLNGKKIHIRSASDAIQKGIAYLPEDRQTQGLVLQMDLKSNVTLAILRTLLKFNFIDRKKEKQITEKCIRDFKIMTTGADQIVNNLSGGNQQRVLVSKWLTVKPIVLFMDEPTRGIDVGTKAEIYNLIKKLSEDDITIILISSELPEVMGMSHRILIMNNGRLVAEFSREDATKEKVMKAALEIA